MIDFKTNNSRIQTKKKILKTAALSGFILLTLFIIFAPADRTFAGSYSDADIKLFVEKCGGCHPWKQAVADFSSRLSGKQTETVWRMKGKKDGWISDAEAEKIISLLSADDLQKVESAAAKVENDLKKENEKNAEEQKTESKIKIIKTFHIIWQSLAFLLLGIYMAATGISKIFERMSPESAFPISFDWQKHVKRGKFYLLTVFLGFCGGVTIWYMDGFDAGDAKLHLFAAFLIAVLYFIGGSIGLLISKGKAGRLRPLHSICNLTATGLFIFNIVTGIILAFN